ncbi:MAG TPA: thioredoxin domain-containing protein [Microthrixaceae bacterium]|nr:thioredoxin domain-containing protein [Microthrixaceae bacterium]
MERLILAAVLAVVAIAVALYLQRRNVAPPTDSVGEFRAPKTLDRADFQRPDAPWLVVVFSSATCDTCAGVWTKAKVLESDQVAVQQVEEKADSELHRKYDIKAVPTTVIVDAAGTVGNSYMGPVSATHLWAGLAELREPGTVPSECGEPRPMGQ